VLKNLHKRVFSRSKIYKKKLGKNCLLRQWDQGVPKPSIPLWKEAVPPLSEKMFPGLIPTPHSLSASIWPPIALDPQALFELFKHRYKVVTTWMGDCLQTGETSLYITYHQDQLSLPSLCMTGVEAGHVHLCQVAGNTLTLSDLIW